MLVLTRKANEAITVGDEIVIRVVRIKGDRVRLGIEAPRSLQVDRVTEQQLTQTEPPPAA